MNFPCSFYDSYWGDYTLIRPFYIFAMNLVYLFDETITCLLLIIVIWTKSFMKIFCQKLSDTGFVAIKANNEDVSLFIYDKMLEWKRQHSLISELVDRFNKLFGPITFLFIYYRFISVIAYSLMVWSTITGILKQKERDILDIYSFSVFISETSKLCMVVYICHILQSEVTFFIH